MNDERVQENRAYLVRSVADGLYRADNGRPRGTDDLLALLVADRVVQHLERLGFVVVRRQRAVSPSA